MTNRVVCLRMLDDDDYNNQRVFIDRAQVTEFNKKINRYFLGPKRPLWNTLSSLILKSLPFGALF